jgi:hypothetical protein
LVIWILTIKSVATPLWAKCEGETHTPKSGKLESSKTPENSKHDFRRQISLHLNNLGVIGKVLKCRCPKWPRMNHLDICSPSYGQKKGRELNWQFDSRPLKVGNWLVPDVRSGSATWRWKALFEESSLWGLQLWFSPRPDQRSRWEVLVVQSPGTSTRDNFGTPLWESRDKKPFGCPLCGVM